MRLHLLIFCKENIFGFMTFHEPGSLVPVDHWFLYSKRRVVALLQKLFPGDDGIFQQDLSPFSTSKKCKNFFAQSGINVLQWPGNSPDLNPIDNLWSNWKQKLAKEDCTAKTSMLSLLIKVWFHKDELEKTCQKLVESMPKLCQEMERNKGGHINY